MLYCSCFMMLITLGHSYHNSHSGSDALQTKAPRKILPETKCSLSKCSPSKFSPKKMLPFKMLPKKCSPVLLSSTDLKLI